MQRIANLVVLEKCCKMRIWVQKSASMQKRTSPLKFGDLAEKSGLNSVSNLSTKVGTVGAATTFSARPVAATPGNTFRVCWAHGPAERRRADGRALVAAALASEGPCRWLCSWLCGWLCGWLVRGAREIGA